MKISIVQGWNILIPTLANESVKMKQKKTTTVNLLRKNSAFCGFGSSVLDNFIPIKSYGKRDTAELEQSAFSVRGHHLIQLYSKVAFNTYSSDFSQATKGLLGGSRSPSSEELKSSEYKEESSSLDNEEQVAFEFINTLEYLRNSNQISQEDLAAVNEISICHNKRVLRSLACNLSGGHKDTLIKIIRTRKALFTVASANSISLLNYANYSFEKLNLKRIFIEEADLRKADLRRADLSGSKMKGVNLKGARLDFSNLSNCDLREVELLYSNFSDRHSDTVISVCLSPDGRYFASGSSDSTIKIWNIQSFDLVQTLLGHLDDVQSVNFSPDGQLLASSGSWDGMIKIWDVQGFSELRTIRNYNGVARSVVFSPDGARLASSSTDSNIRVWNIQTDYQLFTLSSHLQDVTSVFFYSNGNYLASSSRDCTIKLWFVLTVSLVHTIQAFTSYPAMSVSVTQDARFIASAAADGTVKVWNLRSYNLVYNIPGDFNPVFSVKFSRDGRLLAFANRDGIIRVWDVETFSFKHSFRGCSYQSTAINFSMVSSFLAFADRERILNILDLRKFKPISFLLSFLND